MFLSNIPFYGLAVTCIDHPVVEAMVDRLKLRLDGRRLLTYGQSEGADLRLDDIRHDGQDTVFDATLGARVAGGARKLTGWSIPIPGHHNVLNALAAVAVAAEAGITDDQIRQGIASFSGVKRRFQRTGTWNGVDIYDDYGHHPIEIAAVLKAARPGAKGRVFAVVEPHRYSRVKSLFDEFCSCFGDADAVIVAPLYSAGEPPLEGISQRSLADGIRAKGHPSVASIESPADLAPLVRRYAQPGDIVVCLGAGNSTEWAHALPGELADEPRRAGGMR